MKPSPQDIANHMMENDEASRHFGIEIESINEGGCTMTMTVQKWMVNGHGTCHGGVIFTLADSAFAFACNAHNNRVVAQMASITFLSPAKKGDQLTAKAQEVTLAGRSGIYDISVTDEAGTRIAEFRGHSRQISGTHLPEETNA